MKSLLSHLRLDGAGAVTVDWVVLAAAVIGLAIAVASTVRSNSVIGSPGEQARLVQGLTHVEPTAAH